MSVNKVMLIGRVGSDVTIRTAGDQKVASFTLATSEKYKGKDGNMVENTEWHNISIWGKLAEVAEKYVTKGTQLYIEGKIKTEKYQKDGQDKFIVRIVANSMQLLGSKPQSQETPTTQQRFDPRSVQTTSIVDDLPEDDSGLPF